ncbi:hypothetical protein ABBQ38_008783 [Trebouxia sp. C0009 RCD-2024]
MPFDFDLKTPGRRAYGSYQWRVEPIFVKGCLDSPVFVSCRHSWQLRLESSLGCISLTVKSLAPAPQLWVKYQLWIANHERSNRDVHSEGETNFNPHCAVAVRGCTMPKQDCTTGFLKDGHLTLGVHLSVPVADVVVSPEQECTIIRSALCNSIAALFDDSVSSDVVIKAADATVHAHKVILAAQSLPFNAMFQSGMRETDADEVELTDLEGPVLVALIAAMYGKLREIPSGLALPLFLAADAYQIEAMRQACLQQLTNHITIDTVFPCYSAAEAVSENKLSAACIAFTACPANSVLVAQHPDMHTMMRENPDMAQKMWIESASLQAAQQAS